MMPPLTGSVWILEDNKDYQLIDQLANEDLLDTGVLNKLPEIRFFADSSQILDALERCDPKHPRHASGDRYPQIIFLDIKLDGSVQNGIELAKSIRQSGSSIWRAIHLIFLTTSESEVDIAEADEMGLIYLVKPSGSNADERLSQYFERVYRLYELSRTPTGLQQSHRRWRHNREKK